MSNEIRYVEWAADTCRSSQNERACFPDAIERPDADCSDAGSRVNDQRPRVSASRRVPAGSNRDSLAGNRSGRVEDELQ